MIILTLRLGSYFLKAFLFGEIFNNIQIIFFNNTG